MKKILIVGYDYLDLDYAKNAAENFKDILFIKERSVDIDKNAESIIALVDMVDGVVFLENKTEYMVAAVMLNKDIYQREEFEVKKEEEVAENA